MTSAARSAGSGQHAKSVAFIRRRNGQIMRRTGDAGFVRVAVDAEFPSSQIVRQEKSSPFAMVYLVARQADQAALISDRGPHFFDEVELVGILNQGVGRMVGGTIVTKHAGAKLLVTGEAKLIASSPHDQEVFLFGAVGHVADLAGERAVVGGWFCSGDDQFVRNGPRHSSDRVCSLLGAESMVFVTTLAELAGVVANTEEYRGGQRFLLR